MGFLPDTQGIVLWAAGISAASLLISLVAVPWAIGQLPKDYFVRIQRPSRLAISLDRKGFIRLVLATCKNLVGALLVLLGLVMLFTPGQGLLTLLAGILLMNFPGKYRLERALVGYSGVLRALNWLRRKQGKSEFTAPLPGAGRTQHD